MTFNSRRLFGLAALSAMISVGFGAFAAHGLSDPQAQGWLRTGANYQLAHALAVFVTLSAAFSSNRSSRWAAVFFLGGSVLFSGSLYAMALGAPRWLGEITPIGGFGFIAGWALLAWSAFRSPAKPM